MKACLDTNIVIDFLNGVEGAVKVFGSYTPVLSAVVYCEALTKLSAHLDPAKAKAILNGLEVAPIDRGIAEIAADARNSLRMKTPDALIYATAKSLGLLLLTRNTKDFSDHDPVIRVPYRI